MHVCTRVCVVLAPAASQWAIEGRNQEGQGSGTWRLVGEPRCELLVHDSDRPLTHARTLAPSLGAARCQQQPTAGQRQCLCLRQHRGARPRPLLAGVALRPRHAPQRRLLPAGGDPGALAGGVVLALNVCACVCVCVCVCVRECLCACVGWGLTGVVYDTGKGPCYGIVGLPLPNLGLASTERTCL